MKRLYLLIIPILYIWIPVHSKTVHFSYDEAGNRIKREIIISKSNMPKKSTADVGRIEDDLCDKKVSITTGRLYHISFRYCFRKHRDILKSYTLRNLHSLDRYQWEDSVI